MGQPIETGYQKPGLQAPVCINECIYNEQEMNDNIKYKQSSILNLDTSFGIEAMSDARSNHPASFSTVAAVGFRLNLVSIFFETSKTDLGNLLMI